MPLPLSERTGRLARWLERTNERPLLGFTLGSYYPLHRYRRGAQPIPNGAVAPSDIQAAGYLDETDELFEMHEAAGGDLIFSAAPFWGVPWLEALDAPF